MSPLSRALFAFALVATFSSPVFDPTHGTRSTPLLAGEAAASASQQPAVAIDQKVADFTFKDIHYLPRSLADFGEKKAYVIFFTNLDCPMVQRYFPRVKALDESLRDRGVQFLGVNVAAADPLKEIAYQAVRMDAEFPVAKDFDLQVARAVGVTRTATVVVLDAERRLRYRGHVDSQYRLGGEKPDTGREDLKEAIEDVLAGRNVSVGETPVDGCLISPPKAAKPAGVTFTEHIAPLLAQHCQDCHHPGADAPFSLVTYDDAVGHADMIAEVVSEQRMPPWFASREHGKFINQRALDEGQRTLVADWVRGGCEMGDSAKLPKPREFNQGKWRIGTPDLVIQVPQPIKLPASGYVDYKYVMLPYMFLHDTWVQKVQILPSHAPSLHHCNMAWVQPGKNYNEANFITGQVPGGEVMSLDTGVGFKIPQGAVLFLQIHYVTTGEETSDQISVGFSYAKEPIRKQLKHVLVKNTTFHIPPGLPHYKVSAERTLNTDATAVGLFTHMHVRGKDMVYRAFYPDGRQETMLAIPNYSFDWQMPYRFEVGKQKFPKGTRIECVAHYDNSPFNPYNPDPKKTVEEGQQTFQEMMYGFVFYTDDNEQLNIQVDPKTGREVKGS